MAKLITTDITSGYSLATVYNANLDAIELAVENTLSRDGTTPNTMSAALDMNAQRILNVAPPINPLDVATKTYVDSNLATASGAPIWVQTAGEILAGVTPTNTEYPEGNFFRYGAVADAVTDDRAAMQNAINVMSFSNSKIVSVPGGHFINAGTLYCHYNVTNNSGFNSDTTQQGHIIFQGEGACDQVDFTNGTLMGSLIDCTHATDTGISIGDGTLNSRAVVFRDLSIWANGSGKAVHFNLCPRSTGMQRVFVGQAGTGDGVIVNDVWLGFWEDVFCVGDGTNGTGFQIQNLASGGARLNRLVNVTAKSWSKGIILGGDDGTGTSTGGNTLIGCQALSNASGMICGTGCGTSTIMDFHCESNTTVGIRVYRGATNITFLNPYFVNAAATEADFALGDNGADAVNNYKHIRLINARFVTVNETGTGIRKYTTASCEPVQIINPMFTPETTSSGTAITLDNEVQHGLLIERPLYTAAFGTNINFPLVVDLLITGDTLGQYTFGSDVQVTGDIGFFGTSPVSQQTDMAVLADNSGGTANTTLEDCNDVVAGATGDGMDGTQITNVNARLVSIAHNFADCAAQINKIRTALRNLGLMA